MRLQREFRNFSKQLQERTWRSIGRSWKRFWTYPWKRVSTFLEERINVVETHSSPAFVNLTEAEPRQGGHGQLSKGKWVEGGSQSFRGLQLRFPFLGPTTPLNLIPLSCPLIPYSPFIFIWNQTYIDFVWAWSRGQVAVSGETTGTQSETLCGEPEKCYSALVLPNLIDFECREEYKFRHSKAI